MTKQELTHIAKVMADFWHCLTVDVSCIPQFWGITRADIERLERESNDS